MKEGLSERQLNPKFWPITNEKKIEKKKQMKSLNQSLNRPPATVVIAFGLSTAISCYF